MRSLRQDARLMTSFADLGLDPLLLQAVNDAGYVQPSPIQAQCIPAIVQAEDLIGIAQTGTGKTAAFVLPILHHLIKLQGMGQLRGIKALVVAPTRELVLQIQENAQAYARHTSLKVVSLYGGVSERPQIEALKRGADLVVATPGRLLDLMKQGHGRWHQLEFLVLDEADRMLDMGFLPDVRRIVTALPKKRQTLLFSATMSKEIENVTREFLQRPKLIQIGQRSNPAQTVRQSIYEVPKHLRNALLLHLLVDPEQKLKNALVFTKMKHGADRVVTFLLKYGVKAAVFHSDRSQNQRQRALGSFKTGEIQVLVATDIASRGIDVDGISHVFNYDFPLSQEDYVHRIGRTGRAGAEGHAISFILPDEKAGLAALERKIGKSLPRVKATGFDYNIAAPTGRAPGTKPASAMELEPITAARKATSSKEQPPARRRPWSKNNRPFSGQQKSGRPSRD
jgi:ATP-dependent RNA helicase RhlE